jgi:hypothetical protein
MCLPTKTEANKNEPMKTQYTPGPFPLSIQSGGDHFVVVTNQGNHFASTHDPSAARLISSAPTLLNACQTALAFMQSHFPDEHGNPALGMAWGCLEDAIQVATGEEVES